MTHVKADESQAKTRMQAGLLSKTKDVKTSISSQKIRNLIWFVKWDQF